MLNICLASREDNVYLEREAASVGEGALNPKHKGAVPAERIRHGFRHFRGRGVRVST
jgi:hypothetical protein